MAEKSVFDVLNETNEILDDLEWIDSYQGVPIRKVTELPEAEWLQVSRWDVSRGKPFSMTRWGRFKNRWARRRERLADAWKVYKGELEAHDPEVCEYYD